MKIIQVSDLHIDDNTDVNQLKNQISLLVQTLIQYCSINEEIIICVLGDVIDKAMSTS